MSVEATGIFGLVVLACVVYGILKTAQSRASTAAKVIWILVLLLLPVLGFIAWLFIGPKG